MDSVERRETPDEGIKTIRFGIRLLIMVIFLGYIMIWVMMPTNTFWQHWLPDIQDKVNSTYFGQQGTNFLIYTFPILFVAVLGCIYLHLGEKEVGRSNGRIVLLTHYWRSFPFLNSTAKNSRLAQWRRPAFVKGPLGIVSWTGLFFLSTFIALLLWSFSAYIHSMFANITRQSATQMGEKVWEAKLESAGLMLGLLGNICLAFLFFPVTRSSSVMRVIGLTSESGVKYHIWLGHITMTLFTAHGFSYIIFWASTNQISEQKACLVSARILPCEAVELNFSKSPGLSYNPTSNMFINVPGISKLQWHPFTITSNNNTDQDRLSVVIKSTGSWSRLFYQQLSQPIPPDHLEVSVEGPYGPASTHFFRHDTLVLISGGSGITPFCSIIRELLFSASIRSCSTKQVLFIAAFKKSVDLAMLDVLVSDANYNITQFPLRIEAYVTREKELTSDDQKLFQTIWFKPSATDAPVSAILGSNSWLWLGAIISSSFLTFLLLIGIVTRYYIYPIDHNTNMRFSYAEKSVLNMLFGCVSVALAATTAFIWNKKQNAKEMIQIQNVDVPTPKGSPGPGSWLCNGERELESFPHESLFQNTKVHYGERPNFKKLLQECEGSSIGILVSGPKKMRQEVAAICSSSEADNLHFESISFSW
ncbi:hypothetical protein RHMOL_Rhmol03G0216100 [Rhododendron molle]|uniref:Uncharacterized protein n=1 Tax=Rhododendron molle TaxID=49168 RepID=A0ACC0PJF9_RHOML|nr:hypothetical protein RHMOL_Rhmol03G0216100 [Rhododendron molle]